MHERKRSYVFVGTHKTFVRWFEITQWRVIPGGKITCECKQKLIQNHFVASPRIIHAANGGDIRSLRYRLIV